MLDASIREKLWHSMRQDLSRFIPETLSNELLMCPCCGRFLPQKCFSLEHIVPRQVLGSDPVGARLHKETPANVRAGVTLLCKKPLKHKGDVVYANGCNSWKGLWFDKCIRETLEGGAAPMRQTRKGANHIVAMLAAGYLAMVHEYGFAAVLMQSGLLMRQQFFTPRKFLPTLPIVCQFTMLGGPLRFDIGNLDPWLRPFNFEMDLPLGICRVGLRNTIVMLPISGDLTSIQSTRLFIPSSIYTLRPCFDAFFS